MYCSFSLQTKSISVGTLVCHDIFGTSGWVYTDISAVVQ